MSTMGVLQRGLNTILIDLPKKQAARLIEQAVRARTPASIEPKTEPEGVCLAAAFRGCDGESLTLSLPVQPEHDAIHSAYCDVVFRLRGNEYLFTSVALELIPESEGEDGGYRLELEYPSQLQTWQRRRFLRAAVADSAPVYLIPRGTETFETAEGRILNVSPEGLACRLSRDAADRHAVDETVGLSFTIGAESEPFQIDGTVVSKTPGGTRETIIVGLRFDNVIAYETELERLAAALRAFV